MSDLAGATVTGERHTASGTYSGDNAAPATFARLTASYVKPKRSAAFYFLRPHDGALRPLPMTELRQSQAEKQARQQGFHDGYAKRAARSKDSVYQQAWRRGLEARAADERPWRFR